MNTNIDIIFKNGISSRTYEFKYFLVCERQNQCKLNVEKHLSPFNIKVAQGDQVSQPDPWMVMKSRERQTFEVAFDKPLNKTQYHKDNKSARILGDGHSEIKQETVEFNWKCQFIIGVGWIYSAPSTFM